MKAIITNSAGKKVKTISGSTNINGYFWVQFNKYCKEKGYNKEIESTQYHGGMAWGNKDQTDILQLIWIEK